MSNDAGSPFKREPGPYEITSDVDGYSVLFEQDRTLFRVERIREHKDETFCQIEVRQWADGHDDGHILGSKFNLSSADTRVKFANNLERTTEDGQTFWRKLMEIVCTKVVELHQKGEPLKKLHEYPDEGLARFLLRPFLEEQEISVLFGRPGSTKSYLAMCLAVSLTTGAKVFSSRPARTGCVFYMDWESNPRTHKARQFAICRGLGLPVEQPIYYRRPEVCLTDAIMQLRREVRELRPVLVIVDSNGFARGGDPNDAGVTMAMFTAIRSLGVTVLCLDHIPKNAPADIEAPFGSMYTHASARSFWRADRGITPSDGEALAKLVNTKSNNGERLKPEGVKLQFKSDEYGIAHVVDVASIDPSSIRTEVPPTNTEAVLGTLNANGHHPLTKDEIADALEADDIQIEAATLNTTLWRLVKTEKVSRFRDNRGKDVYGLRALP